MVRVAVVRVVAVLGLHRLQVRRQHVHVHLARLQQAEPLVEQHHRQRRERLVAGQRREPEHVKVPVPNVRKHLRRAARDYRRRDAHGAVHAAVVVHVEPHGARRRRGAGHARSQRRRQARHRAGSPHARHVQPRQLVARQRVRRRGRGHHSAAPDGHAAGVRERAAAVRRGAARGADAARGARRCRHTYARLCVLLAAAVTGVRAALRRRRRHRRRRVEGRGAHHAPL
mmetsp:Transcript_13618/g.47465  ORF Transcript_13618/g.47465 Transcript_13618/m.47465 type:complete len:228 (-) Transcript_13618:1518-2201(-)